MIAQKGPSLLVLCDRVDRAGGTEAYLSRVLPGLRDRGFDVRVAARRVVDAAAFGVPAIELDWSADDAPAKPAAAAAVRALIAAWSPDAVMTSNVHDAATMAAARSSPKLIVRVHDHRIFCPQGDRQYPHFPALCTRAMTTATCLSNAVLRGCIAGLSARSLRLLRSRQALRDVVLQADHVIVSSAFIAGLCTQNGVDPHRIAILPPPFGSEISRGARPARDRVLFAGRLVRDKGLASLIRALANIPSDVRPELAVAGSMTAESQGLPGLATRSGVRMRMLGHLDNAALNAEIDASTLIAVPSLWPEPFGLIGIEAQARGRPVVAYDVGGISAWMGAAGLLVPRGDERELARAIVTVLEPARWAAFSEAAVRQADAYRIEKHVESVSTLLAPGRFAQLV